MNKVFTERAQNGAMIVIPSDLIEALLANPVQLRQYANQVAMAEAARETAKPLPTAEDLIQQHQPVRPFVTFSMMAQQQQGGTRGPLSAEERAANEVIRQRQYKAQLAMLAGQTAPTP